VSNSLDPDETPKSASHPDPSCLDMALWFYFAGLGLNSNLHLAGLSQMSREGFSLCTFSLRVEKALQIVVINP